MVRKLRQNSSLRMGMRLTLAAAAVAISGLIAMLIIVFNLSREQISHAETNMTFKAAETMQETNKVLRGSINQCILGVMVETMGSGNALKMNTIEFNANGTTMPIVTLVENARLWYTGTSPDFIPAQQLTSTILKITDKNFSFNCNQTLVTGKNYFWLTYDVKPDAEFDKSFVDAECTEMKIGAKIGRAHV